MWIIPAEALKGREGVADDFRRPLSPEETRAIELTTTHARDGKLFPSAYWAGVVSEVGMSKVLNQVGEAGRVNGSHSAFADRATAQGVAFDHEERCLQNKVGNKVAQAYRRDDQLAKRRGAMNARRPTPPKPARRSAALS